MVRLAAPAGAVLAALALSAPALAETECAAPATGCDNDLPSLTAALGQAATHPGDDTVRLAAATYSEHLPAYAPADAAAVSIIGAGRGATTITDPAPVASGRIIDATTGALNVSHLSVVLPAAVGPYAIYAALGGTIDDVAVTSDPSATDPNGVAMTANGTISNTSISTGSGGACIFTAGAGTTVQVLDSSLSDCSAGISMQAATTIAARLLMSDVGIGVGLYGCNHHGQLDDSLVRPASGGTGAQVTMNIGCTDGANQLLAEQDTFAGAGTGVAIDDFNHTATVPADITVRDSIMRGFATSLSVDSDSASHPTALTADHNDYNGTISPTGPGESLVTTNAVSSDPLFADAPGGNFRLQAASVVLDADAFALNAPETPFDLDGSLRVIGGKRDLGAYERPLAPGAAAQDATAIGQMTATLRGTATGGGARAAWHFVYGATPAYGSATPDRQTAPSASGEVVSAGLAGLAASTTIHYALVVTNAAGTTESADHSLTTAAATVPPPVFAQLQALAISPATFRAAARGAAFARARTGATVTVTMSIAGTVTFRVLRRAPGIRRGSSCVAPAAHATGRRCTRLVAVGRGFAKAVPARTSTLRFSGRVGGRRLAPGRYLLQGASGRAPVRRASFRIVAR